MTEKFSFGASTWLWTSPFSSNIADELFEKISTLGFDAVEIAVEDPSIIKAVEVRDALAKHNLQGIICGAFGASRDLTSEDPQVHQNCFKYINDCFEICRVVGAKFLAGPMYSAVGKARMVAPDQRKREWDLAVKNLQIVCGMAEDNGLQIALEPLNRFESDLVNNSEDVCRLVEDIGHPAARIMLDSFHMNIEERNVEQAIKGAADKLIHFQVSENYRGIPGTGTTPWKEYFRALHSIGYSGTVSIESFTPENQELAGAVCIWRPFADNQDDFASQGLAFLKSCAASTKPSSINSL